MRKKIILVVVVMGILLLLPVFMVSAKKEELNIICESGGFMLQEPIAKKFEAETGYKVNLINVPYKAVYEKVLTEIAAGGATYDVATIDVIWIPKFAPYAEPLDDLFTPEVKADLFPSLLADAHYGGKYVCMPVWTNIEILFYRKDLFEDPKEKAAFKARYGYELRPPRNWREFIDVAVFFTRDTDGDGKIDLYGTDVKGAGQGIDCDYPMLVLQAGSKGIVLDDDGNIIVDNQAHIEALKFYTDLYRKYKVSPPSVFEIDWAIAQKFFYEGKTAMMRFWAHAYRLIPEDAKVAGKVGVAPMIAGKAGIAAIPGPWYNMILKTSKNKDIARQYVKFAYENNVLQLEAPLGLAARKSAFASYVGKPGYEYIEPLMKTMSAPQTRGRPLVENWVEINDEVLVPMVQDVLAGEKTPEEAVKWAREQLETLVRK